MKKSQKQKWENLYSSVSFDGLHYIFETKGIRRIFWTMIVVGFTSLAIVLFYGVISDFLSHKTTTMREEIFHVQKIGFPTVTICNLNSVSKKKLQSSPIKVSQDELVQFYQDIRDGTVDTSKPQTQHVMEELKLHNITSVREIMSMFELQVIEMLEDPITKALKSSPCLFNNYTCSKDDFFPVTSEAYGLCFQFHSFYGNKLLHVEESGEGSGLELYLNIHEEDMVVSRVPYQGLVVFVHPYGTPFEAASGNLLPVRPGSMTFAHVRLNYLELLPPPYQSSCSSKPYKYVYSNVPYSQAMCTIDHITEAMVSTCGCVSLEFSHHSDVKECTVNDVKCVEKTLKNLHSLIRKYRTICPIECNVTKYIVDSAQTTLGNSVVLQKLLNLTEYNFTKNTARDYFRNNMIGLNVAFTDLIFTRETISATQNWVTILSSIGGSIGLCIGCSLISFIELGVFAMEWLWSKLTRSKKASSPTNGANNSVFAMNSGTAA